ncbi:MAG TPA: carboxypeptidase-like regulatory domain-containing protein [Vicinamibacterales bacterium]|nr:carboxypeptidase-like regulatory domain-containing protein [Vicinamibacterales bacterium]
MAVLAGPLSRPRRRRGGVMGFAAIALSLLLVSCQEREQTTWGPFRAQVVDSETGLPLAGVHVMAEWRQTVLNPVSSISKFYDATETVTDASGRFEIPRLERWSYWTREPDFEFFAPGYTMLGGAFDVTPPGGRYLVDPTVVKLRPLKTREERCADLGGAPLHHKAPRFLEAVHTYHRGLRCYELREHPRK